MADLGETGILPPLLDYLKRMLLPPPKVSPEEVARALEWRKSLMYGRDNPPPIPQIGARTPQQNEADRLASWLSAASWTPEQVRAEQGDNPEFTTQGAKLSGWDDPRLQQAVMATSLAPLSMAVSGTPRPDMAAALNPPTGPATLKLRDAFGDQLGKLSPSEVAAMDEWKGSPGVLWAGEVRKPGQQNPVVAKMIDGLDRGLGKVKTNAPLTVYRTGMVDHLPPGGIAIGEGWVDSGFAATSVNPPSKFPLALAPERVAKIRIPAGHPALPVDLDQAGWQHANARGFRGEHEVLLPRNTEFIYRGKEDGHPLFDVAPIRPAPAPNVNPRLAGFDKIGPFRRVTDPAEINRIMGGKPGETSGIADALGLPKKPSAPSPSPAATPPPSAPSAVRVSPGAAASQLGPAASQPKPDVFLRSVLGGWKFEVNGEPIGPTYRTANDAWAAQAAGKVAPDFPGMPPLPGFTPKEPPPLKPPKQGVFRFRGAEPERAELRAPPREQLPQEAGPVLRNFGDGNWVAEAPQRPTKGGNMVRQGMDPDLKLKGGAWVKGEDYFWHAPNMDAKDGIAFEALDAGQAKRVAARAGEIFREAGGKTEVTDHALANNVLRQAYAEIVQHPQPKYVGEAPPPSPPSPPSPVRPVRQPPPLKAPSPEGWATQHGLSVPPRQFAKHPSAFEELSPANPLDMDKLADRLLDMDLRQRGAMVRHVAQGMDPVEVFNAAKRGDLETAIPPKAQAWFAREFMPWYEAGGGGKPVESGSSLREGPLRPLSTGTIPSPSKFQLQPAPGRIPQQQPKPVSSLTYDIATERSQPLISSPSIAGPPKPPEPFQLSGAPTPKMLVPEETEITKRASLYIDAVKQRDYKPLPPKVGIDDVDRGKPIGKGGVHRPAIVEIGGKKAFAKKMERGETGAAELAAYEAQTILGVKRTPVRVDPDQGVDVVVKALIPKDAVTIDDWTGRLEPKSAMDLFAFDMLGDTRDRHWHNVVITPNGKAVGIDFDSSFGIFDAIGASDTRRHELWYRLNKQQNTADASMFATIVDRRALLEYRLGQINGDPSYIAGRIDKIEKIVDKLGIRENPEVDLKKLQTELKKSGLRPKLDMTVSTGNQW